jgi:hypothetical protein
MLDSPLEEPKFYNQSRAESPSSREHSRSSSLRRPSFGSIKEETTGMAIPE